MSRRDLLRGLGAGAGAAGLGALLSACGNAAGASPTITSLPLPRKNHPVRWPIFKDNQPIPSGLKPEVGATLKLYNWTAYINQAVINNFQKKYKCSVEWTSFNTITDAISKIKSGEADYDVFVPTPDNLGQLIEAKLIQPLNHSYIPNIAQCWPDFLNPFYDQGWQYTVPYTVYTTGITWRKDHVDGNPAQWKNGFQFPWQKKYAGKVAILDDYRESLSLGLMYNGNYDLNTTSASQLRLSKASLDDLDTLVGGVQIDNNDYTNVPSGQVWIHHAWSGDMAAAASYMPKGVPVEVVGYWFPANGVGPVANDNMVVLKTSKAPVLAHLFLNYFLDLPNVIENISFNGYIQPLIKCTPELLVQEKILPPSLMSTVVLPSYFRNGLFELELPPTADVQWEQDWLEFSGGI
ncbi:MAG TPA: spermidine/putrescine ABC transporter substrate-binding protein [Acidimicrobiales bacterium]|nr:spermidine/putrescine ABC transporter substrate-binding protein [Acidimicrobiales bacterium]